MVEGAGERWVGGYGFGLESGLGGRLLTRLQGNFKILGCIPNHSTMLAKHWGSLKLKSLNKRAATRKVDPDLIGELCRGINLY